MADIPIQFSHLGLWVHDLEKMQAFYSDVMGFAVTDKGVLNGTIPIVFLSRDPNEHHQIVLAQGREGQDAKVVNQISFRLPDLGSLKRLKDRLAAGGHGPLTPITHGNAWSIYFPDPEGNRIEIFVDSDWYIEQPCREPLDLDRSESEIRAETEAFCRAQPSFMPMADYRAKMARLIADHIAAR